MRQIIEKILSCYGMTALLPGFSREVRAFLQPVGLGSRAADREITPLGLVPEGQYTYIGPAEPAVQVGDAVEFGGKVYLFRRVEQFQDQNGPVYCWGLCVEKGGANTWGQ